MRNGVREKPLAGEAVDTRRGKVSAGALMHHERHSESGQRLVERVVIGIVQRASVYRIGTDKNSLKAELSDGTAGLTYGRHNVLHGNGSDAHEALAVGAAVVVEPIVVGTTKRCGIRFL